MCVKCMYGMRIDGGTKILAFGYITDTLHIRNAHWQQIFFNLKYLNIYNCHWLLKIVFEQGDYKQLVHEENVLKGCLRSIVVKAVLTGQRVICPSVRGAFVVQ